MNTWRNQRYRPHATSTLITEAAIFSWFQFILKAIQRASCISADSRSRDNGSRSCISHLPFPVLAITGLAFCLFCSALHLLTQSEQPACLASRCPACCDLRNSTKALSIRLPLHIVLLEAVGVQQMFPASSLCVRCTPLFSPEGNHLR